MNDSIAKGIDPITLPIGAETSSGGVKGSPSKTTVLSILFEHFTQFPCVLKEALFT